jgi:hypothetical protein
MVSFPRNNTRGDGHSSSPARPRTSSAARADANTYNQVRERVQRRLLSELSPTVT